MRRSNQRKMIRRKRRSESKLYNQASKGAKNLIDELNDQGFTLSLRDIPRTGVSGNLIKRDIKDFIYDNPPQRSDQSSSDSEEE